MSAMLRTMLLMAVVFSLASFAMAQAAPATARPHTAHKSRSRTQTAPDPMPQPVTPPQPEPPKWPVNDAPSQPAVTWNSQGLHIQASNASLSRILTEVSTQTGAKIEGLSGDQRVFGDYGPGQAGDVLSQLLNGSGYNFLLLGDQGQGTPREVILSAAQRTSPARQPNAGFSRSIPDQSGDEDSAPEQPEEDPTQVMPPPPPQQPELINPQGPVTPQQRMQMMQQQRMQQLQQNPQQFQQNPQQLQQPQ